MEFLAPTGLDEALQLKAAHPDAVPIMGGTDVMVELNFDRRRPEVLLDLTRIRQLQEWDGDGDGGRIRLGAGVSYRRVITELAGQLPGLALAARTVGSPQIRNRGSVGGNLGAASPAGDAHPPLLAADAEIELSSVRGVRLVAIDDFYLGVKRHAGAPDELITAIWLTPATGAQQFSKVGTRNAMVIAVCSFALALHPDRQLIRTGIGSAAPTPRRASSAEELLNGALETENLWHSRGPLRRSLVDRFADLVAEAAAPIDDVRGTADYRRRALAVMGRRCLGWAWADYQGSAA